MLGSDSDPGMIPCSIRGIFQHIEEESEYYEERGEEAEWQYKVTFSYLEIYNEKVCIAFVFKTV